MHACMYVCMSGSVLMKTCVQYMYIPIVIFTNHEPYSDHFLSCSAPLFFVLYLGFFILVYTMHSHYSYRIELLLDM